MRQPDKRKLKAQSILIEIAIRERKYRDAIAHNADDPFVTALPIRPQKLEIGIMYDSMVIWYTVEPHSDAPAEVGVQCWDERRQKLWTWGWEQIWDTKLSSDEYEPQPAEVWVQRIRENNLRHVEENLIRQRKVRYW